MTQATKQTIDGVDVSIEYTSASDAPVTDAEIRAYIDRGNAQHPNSSVTSLDLEVDGQDGHSLRIGTRSVRSHSSHYRVLGGHHGPLERREVFRRARSREARCRARRALVRLRERLLAISYHAARSGFPAGEKIVFVDGSRHLFATHFVY